MVSNMRSRSQSVHEPNSPRPGEGARDPGDQSGHLASFHLADGRVVEVAIAGVSAISTSGDSGPTRLEVFSGPLRDPNRRRLAAGNLAELLARTTRRGGQ